MLWAYLGRFLGVITLGLFIFLVVENPPAQIWSILVFAGVIVLCGLSWFFIAIGHWDTKIQLLKSRMLMEPFKYN